MLRLALLLTVFLGSAFPPLADAQARAPRFISKDSDALSTLRGTEDEETGTIWYTHDSVNIRGGGDAFYVYFGRTRAGHLTRPRLRVRYASDSPLYIKRAVATADGARVLFPQAAQAYGWARNPRGGEWSDAALAGSNEIAAVRRIAAATSVTVRFDGRHYYNERVLSEQQLKALRETLNVYVAAGGELP